MKTKAEIIQGLRVCAKESGCMECPYFQATSNCIEEMMLDALNLIESGEEVEA